MPPSVAFATLLLRPRIICSWNATLLPSFGVGFNLFCLNLSLLLLFQSLRNHWSDQTKDVVLAFAINTFWVIWFCRNQSIFKSKSISFDIACHLMFVVGHLVGQRFRGCMSNFVSKFSLLKRFGIDIHPPKPQIIKEVLGVHPQFGTVKCNTNRSTLGSLGLVVFFVTTLVVCLVVSLFLQVCNQHFLEALAAIISMETAKEKGWNNV